MKNFLIACFFMVMFANVSSARLVPEITYKWTAPTSGSAVILYMVQWKVDSGEWEDHCTTPDDFYVFVDEFEYGKQYEVRVAGVDGEGRVGGFSDSSVPFTPDLGPPGQPSAPAFISIIEYTDSP